MPQPRHLNRFWIAAILLAWAADLLFWGHPAGLSYPLWTFLALLALFLCAYSEGKHPAWPSYFLAASTFGLSLSVVLRGEPFSRGLNVLLSLSGLALLSATLLNGHWLRYRLGDFVVAAAKCFAAAIVRGAGGTIGPKPPPIPETDVPNRPPAPNRSNVWRSIRKAFPILRGLLFALPVLLVLASLLSAADPVFARYIQNLLSVFDLTRLPEYIFRLFYILVFAYVFVGLFLHAVLPDSIEKRPDPNLAWNTRFLGSTESFVILGLVLALFAFFIGLQFRYLFGGEANIHETGFTFSEYARRGFFELVWVAVLSLLLYLALSTLTRRTAPSQQRVFSVLCIALFAMVLVMLVSALQRLTLYEAAYGFTRLRAYTHILIPWLGILLVAAIIMEALRSAGRFTLALLLTVIGFGLSFTALNVDGLIADFNLRRLAAGSELDARYLASLSSDATPALVSAYLTQRDATYKDALGLVLACHWIQSDLNQNNHRNWRSYTLSSALAARALAPLDLSPYLEESTDTPKGGPSGSPPALRFVPFRHGINRVKYTRENSLESFACQKIRTSRTFRLNNGPGGATRLFSSCCPR